MAEGGGGVLDGEPPNRDSREEGISRNDAVEGRTSKEKNLHAALEDRILIS